MGLLYDALYNPASLINASRLAKDPIDLRIPDERQLPISTAAENFRMSNSEFRMSMPAHTAEPKSELP